MLGYSQTKNSNFTFLNNFFHDLKNELHLNDTILTTHPNEIDTFSLIKSDTLYNIFQLINEPIKFVKLERGEKEELNRKFNYSIDYNQIYDTKFITIPIDTVLFNNGDKLNREKRIKEFIEKYISQQYYTFSEPLLLKDENYCYFEYEIGSFFSPHSIRKQTLFKKIDGKWKEWIVISFQHTF